MRYCFKRDDDGHNFLMPTGLADKFDEMLKDGEDDHWAAFSNEFGQYAIDSLTNWSFEDPKEDM